MEIIMQLDPSDRTDDGLLIASLLNLFELSQWELYVGGLWMSTKDLKDRNS